jgi:uncharacterized protein
VQSTFPASAPTTLDDQQTRLADAIEHAAHLLPGQGPITVFIHHNTLHAFEDFPFDEGVRKGSRIFGCEPYLSGERYRQELVRGRIRVSDLAAILQKDMGMRGEESILSLGTRKALRLAMLTRPLRKAPDAELQWFMAETDALSKVRPETTPEHRERLIARTRHWIMRDSCTENGSSSLTASQRSRLQDLLRSLLQQSGEAQRESWDDATWEAFSLGALWRICQEGVMDLPNGDSPPAPPVRHRDLLQQAGGEDPDLLVNEVLIRFCAAFLDQGFARWQLPDREQGFLHAFSLVYGKSGGPADLWQRGLAKELRRVQAQNISPLSSILESLAALGVPAAEWDEFLAATLLALRGWGGMIRQIEIRCDRVAHSAPRGSLVEFLAVRLLLDRWATDHVAKSSLGTDVPLDKLRSTLLQQSRQASVPAIPQRAFIVFQLAQLLGWLPEELFRLNREQWGVLLQEIESFSDLERRRIYHRAFERRFTVQTLDAIHIHSIRDSERIKNPRFQVLCCLDEREESFRRHLEEVAPHVETFGAAGFYGVAMYYRGTADAHFTPLCPIVIQPRHWVSESVLYSQEDISRRRATARRALGAATHQLHVGSRSLYGGALLTAGFGVLASVPLVARILFPRLTAWIRRGFGRLVRPPTLTQLQLERSDPAPGPNPGHVGFTVEEMADMGERLLRDVGLTSGFARLVIILGHGSNSLNNPHKSAYDCGACGGNSGGPNARALAQLLNDLRVRAILLQRGLEIPADTVFVGGFHNTCNDEVTLLDVDFVPPSHWDELAAAQQVIELTCDRNAHERCRRFQSAPLSLSFSAARRHVEERSEDLSQARPECGHASNAICVVGRRGRTRGLFLDRRAFLVSYDPLQDDEQSAILARILGAVFPVCAGINLEYYFSYVDSPGWGSGTKLPHNITSLLGVMDGAASDLRTGLPWQMVEIHEPLRLLFVIETTPERILQIMRQNEGIGRLCRNGWVQLAVLDPHSNQIQIFRQGEFVPYEPEIHELKQVSKSADWYRGWRDNLEFAQIEPAKNGK